MNTPPAYVHALTVLLYNVGTIIPHSFPTTAQLIGCLYEALAICETATLASECLSGLFASCVSQSRAAGDDDYQSDTSSASSGMVLGDAASGALVSGSSRRSNWSQAAGFKKARQGIGGGGGIGGPGSGSGARMTGRMSGAGAVVIAAATVATPERQLANVLLLQRLLDGFQTLLQGAAMVYREQQEQVRWRPGNELLLWCSAPARHRCAVMAGIWGRESEMNLVVKRNGNAD